MVDFLHGDEASILHALLAERMFMDIAVTDSLPSPAVAFACGVTALELLVVSVHLSFVFRTIYIVGEIRASRKAARPLRFLWHEATSFLAKKKPCRVIPQGL